jgi:ABC-type phosphate transport system substrate-binding protein
MATAATLAAAGFALYGGDALAANANPIYGGGGTLSEPSIRLWMDCAATPLTADPANYPASANFTANCTTTKGVYSTFKYYLTATGSGAGLVALLTETSPSALSSNGNGPGTTAGGTTATAYNSPTDTTSVIPTGQPTAYPYGFWDITDSDAPANSPSPMPGSSTTVNGDYNIGGFGPNGFNTKQNRGALWGVPVAATPVTIPYNPTNMNFVILPGSTDHEDHKLQLSKDALCYIYTKADSNGQVVPGAYDWSNPIFISNNFGQTAQGPGVTNPNTGNPEINPLPLNAVYTYNAHTKVYTVTSQFSVTPNATQGNANPIIPFARSDDSGTSYLMTLWLEGNCLAFNDNTLGTATAQPGQTLVSSSAFGQQVPATTVTWPTWVNTSYKGGVGGVTGASTAVTGSGGMATAVQTTPGGVGYVAPTSVEPVKAGTVPSAYLENGYGGVNGATKHQYVEPTVATVEAAITKVGPPVLTAIKNPACGTQNVCGTGNGQPPPTLKGTQTVAWGSGLNKIFFHGNNVGAYGITGLTYVFGYQCYQADSGNDPFDGVLDLVAYYTNSGAGNNVDADNLLLSQGLVPLDYDTKTNGVDANGNQRTFVRAIYDVVAVDPATKMIPVHTGDTFPNNPNTGKPLNGPYQCPQYAVDGSHE